MKHAAEKIRLSTIKIWRTDRIIHIKDKLNIYKSAGSSEGKRRKGVFVWSALDDLVFNFKRV